MDNSTYEKIVEAIRSSYLFEDYQPNRGYDIDIIYRDLIFKLSEVIGDTDSSFDHVKFLKDCGIW